MALVAPPRPFHLPTGPDRGVAGHPGRDRRILGHTARPNHHLRPRGVRREQVGCGRRPVADPAQHPYHGGSGRVRRSKGPPAHPALCGGRCHFGLSGDIAGGQPGRPDRGPGNFPGTVPRHGAAHLCVRTRRSPRRLTGLCGLHAGTGRRAGLGNCRRVGAPRRPGGRCVAAQLPPRSGRTAPGVFRGPPVARIPAVRSCPSTAPNPTTPAVPLPTGAPGCDLVCRAAVRRTGLSAAKRLSA